MVDAELKRIIKASHVVIHPGRYAYLRVSEIKPGTSYFAATKDEDEFTVIAEERDAVKIKFEEAVKWFKLVEVKVSKPFVAKGFLAAITGAISDKGLNVLVVSTFSKDYMLVREEGIGQAIKSLKELGFPVEA